MPKPSWAENLEAVKMPPTARAAVTTVTLAQWAWYKEQGGDDGGLREHHRSLLVLFLRYPTNRLRPFLESAQPHDEDEHDL